MRVSGLRRAALVGACSAAFVAATQAQDSGTWTEHLLANVPRELSPNTLAWDSWISLTPDLSSVAYAVRFRSGDFWRESVVIRGRRQPEYNYASRAVISPDGRHVAYIAVVESGDSSPAFLVVDEARVQIQYR